MTRKRLPVWRVALSRPGGLWKLFPPRGWKPDFSSRLGWVCGCRTKSTMIAHVAKAAREDSRRSPLSVRIHLRNGRIQEERTYPRGADPRRSRG